MEDQIRAEVARILNELSTDQRQLKPDLDGNSDFISTSRLDQTKTKAICQQLYEISKHGPGDMRAMDGPVEGIFRHWFIPWGDWIIDEISLAEAAVQLLLRLPQNPLPYCLQYHDELENHLLVPSIISQNVARMALRTCILQDRPRQSGRRAEPFWAMAHITEDIALLFRTAENMVLMVNEQRQWNVVKSYLWTNLQQLFMLWTWSIVSQTIRDGFVSELIVKHRGQVDRIRPIILHQMRATDMSAKPDMPEVLCPWALQLLQDDAFSLCMDIRRPLAIYATTFLGHPPRCQKPAELPKVCNGSGFENCGRFVGAEVEQQSAHQCATEDCPKLTWHEETYRSQEIPVVDIDSSDTELRYSDMSHDNLAISHVWAHGQGGRPETGLNSCLHKRYSEIAKQLACNTYWMDTPCIATDKTLRKAAIGNINHIFYESKSTLICDRDLMEIDITELPEPLRSPRSHSSSDVSSETSPSPAAVKICESLLISLLLCDWNVRGWTFLESMRGRKQLYLLCKDNEICQLICVLQVVLDYGCIELINLFLSTAHLMHIPESRYPRLLMSFGTIEEAGAVLSKRPASHPPDNLAIWSLLFFDVGENFTSEINRKAKGASRAWRDGRHKTAREMWKSQRSVATSFLVSSAPRISNPMDVKGLSWAPESPVPATVCRSRKSRRYAAYANIGGDVETGWIRNSGLVATWYTSFFLGQAGTTDTAQEISSKVLDAFKNTNAPYYEDSSRAGFHSTDEFDILSQPFRTNEDYDQRLEGVHSLSILDKMGFTLQHILSFSREHKAITDVICTISNIYLSQYRYGALLRPATGAITHSGLEPLTPLVYKNDPRAPLMAICGSNNGREWIWRGVHLWDSSLELPLFKLRKILIA